MVRRTGRGGLGNVSTRKGRERQEKRKSTAANRKPDSEIAKVSATTKGKRRRSSTALEDRENDEQATDYNRTHRRSGSTSSRTGSLTRRRSVRSRGTVQVRRKGINRLWSTVASIGAKNSRTKANEPTEFEIIELRSSVEQELEYASPPSPEAAAISCIMSASAAASANRALALARLERGSRRIRLGEVPEEDPWVDDDRQDTASSASPIIPREVLQRHLQSLPSDYTRKESRPTKCTIVPRIRTNQDRIETTKDAMWRYPFTDVEGGTNISRDSVGTFGLRRNSVVYEKDEDDAESILDPYMHSP